MAIIRRGNAAPASTAALAEEMLKRRQTWPTVAADFLYRNGFVGASSQVTGAGEGHLCPLRLHGGGPSGLNVQHPQHIPNEEETQ